MANIDTLKSKLTTIAGAIRTKTGGAELLTIDEMPTEILSIDGGNAPNPDDPLLLIDWDGTLLYSYTYEDAQLISEFPDPPTHEGLTFQNWNWAEAVVKTWLQNHRGAQLKVGAVYTPTDGQDHNYWRSPRLSANNQIYKQHRATATLSSGEFSNYFSLEKVSLPNGLTSVSERAFYFNYALAEIVIPRGVQLIDSSAFYHCESIKSVCLPHGVIEIEGSSFSSCGSLTYFTMPDSVTSIGISAFSDDHSLFRIALSRNLAAINGSAFSGCYSLPQIDIPSSVTLIGAYAFNHCLSLTDVVIHGTPTLGGSVVFYDNPLNQRIYVHRSDLSWFETATNWSAIYGEGKIVAAADYIEYLQSIGIDTSDFEGE